MQLIFSSKRWHPMSFSAFTGFGYSFWLDGSISVVHATIRANPRCCSTWVVFRAPPPPSTHSTMFTFRAADSRSVLTLPPPSLMEIQVIGPGPCSGMNNMYCLQSLSSSKRWHSISFSAFTGFSNRSVLPPPHHRNVFNWPMTLFGDDYFVLHAVDI